jgi:predicted ArsR family transcriptional regulator
MGIKETELLSQPTRMEIIMLLKKQLRLSAQEIAKQVGISEMAIRQHLYSLKKHKFVQKNMSRKTTGRPAILYSLTEKANHAFVKSYDQLLIEMLEDLVEIEGVSEVTNLFERRKSKLHTQYQEIAGNKSLDERVAHLTMVQKNDGYMAEMSRTPEGDYLLQEANCPILRISERYPYACQCELALFQEVLQTRVERLECLANGGNRCLYLIQNIENEGQST